MKTTSLIISGSLLLLAQCISAVAAPFQNLDFEQARTNPAWDGGMGPIEELLPGWNLSLEGRPVASVGYNFSRDDLDYATLYSFLGPNIEGSYGLRLWDAPSQVHYSLTQMGEIPAESQYLQYTYVGGPPKVSINGEIIGGLFPSHRVSQRSRTVQLDISRFAGQSVELGFHTQSGGFITSPSTELDGISFVVPEPSTLALGLVAGGLFAGAHLWRVRSKRWSAG